jgi:hypothetical protein
LLGVTLQGSTAQRSIAYHWDPEKRVGFFDGETHLRPLWVNRSPKHLAEAREATDAWFERHTQVVSIRDLLPSQEGCKVHAIQKGKPVNFRSIFQTVADAKIERAELQDPYLLTRHHMKCFGDFLAGLAWLPAGASVPFRLITQLSDSDPRQRDQLTAGQQEQELQAKLKQVSTLAPQIDRRYWKYSPLHMRYALFQTEGGRNILYVLERGLDMEDPRTGKARGDTYVLEFPEVPRSFQPLLTS